MKRTGLIMLFILSLSACRCLRDTGGREAQVVYELRLQAQAVSLSDAGFGVDRDQPEVVYRTSTLEEALYWQENLLESGIVTLLRKKGGPLQ